MAKVKVGVAGYGVIGQRLADGVSRQGDMERPKIKGRNSTNWGSPFRARWKT